MKTIVIELPNSEVIKYAKDVWDEHDWERVKSIRVTVKPYTVLVLFDEVGNSLGAVQGEIDFKSIATMEVNR